MKKFIFILVLLIPVIGSTQNLVPNSSFEYNTQCPTDQGQLSFAFPWYSPSLGTPDYYNVCGSYLLCIPQNMSGYQQTHFGQAYAGFLAFDIIFNKGMEYLQTELLDTLKQGLKYYIEFYISLADTIPYAATHVGAYISDTAVGNYTNSNMPILPYTPQVISSTFAQVTNKNGWSKISGNYIAHGGEKFITIGNFNPYSYPDTVYIGGSSYLHRIAYYYVDDVYVGIDTTVNIIEEKINDFKFQMYPNPSFDKVTINYIIPTGKTGTLKIYDLLGVMVKDISFIGAGNKTVSLGLPVGLYMYKFMSEGKVVNSGKQLIVK